MLLPVCPICGAVLKEGTTTCSCGTTIVVSSDDELEHLLTIEAQKVEKFRDLKAKCLEAFDEGDFEKSFDYSTEALNLGIGSDAELSFARGKSLYYMNRFTDSLECFDEYITEYKNSFYRFSNISGAYEWKAAVLWQLGDGFEAIKCYYNAMEFVDNKPCSIDEKMEIRSRIEESRLKVMQESRGEGVSNPRIGPIDEQVYGRLEQYGTDIHITMQNLYDAIDEVKSDECEFKTLLLKDDNVYAEFIEDGKSLEKCFDGTSTFK